MLVRREIDIWPQVSNAAVADATTASMSAESASATWPVTWPVAGL